jgi:serine/threonine protein kinase/formylglycine-generating enzyme required for sulfatase activity
MADDSLPTEVAAQIDPICQQFEAAWQRGDRPRIEDFLDEARADDRSVLLAELLWIEIAFRQKAGEQPNAAEYLRRFPEHRPAIRAFLSGSGTGADRNLLLGILALQNNFITRQQLLTAFDQWTTDKSRSLGEILENLGAITADRRLLLEALMAEHLKLHDNDAENSLADLTPVGSVSEDLKRLGDVDVDASLAHVSLARGDDPNTTLPWTVGESTSAGVRFRILRPHARGGLGEVYVARDEELHREVALKEIQERHAHDPNSRSRFLLEAEITGGLEHPGIVPVYGLGTYADGRPFYAMRFIKGDSLKEAINRFHCGVGGVSVGNGLRAVPPDLPLPSGPSGECRGEGSVPQVGQAFQPEKSERQARKPDLHRKRAAKDAFSSLEFRKLLGRFIDVCNAIEYAHSRGVLHRDLKPGNIMLGKYGETLVVDWGLAKVVGRSETTADTDERTLHPSSGSDSAPTQMGSAVGTPQYMSPEQAEGRLDQLGPASDVYSLGATLYTLLTGKPPFSAADLVAILSQVAKGDFPSPRAINADIPRPLEAICLTAMSVKPQDRYPAPRALADDIEHWLADEPLTAVRDNIGDRAARWTRRHRALARSAAIALLLVSVVSLAAVLVVDRARRNEETARIAADQAAQREREQAQRAAEALADLVIAARAEDVPYALDKLHPVRDLALSAFRREFDDPDGDTTRRIHAACGLAALDKGPQRFLIDVIPTAPDSECGNIIAALSHESETALVEVVRLAESATDRTQKARYAIVAMHLGNAHPAIQSLARYMMIRIISGGTVTLHEDEKSALQYKVNKDEMRRTIFIQTYSRWHGELANIADLLRSSENESLRSGMCAALGLLPATSAKERDALSATLAELYQSSTDTGTHSAAAWALLAWGLPLPPTESTSDPLPGHRWHVNRQGMTMIEIPAGKFEMGWLWEGDGALAENFKESTIDWPFLLCDREVTIEQFQRFADDNSNPMSDKPIEWQGVHKFSGQTSDCPVQKVSWYDAISFCNWLSKQEGKQPCYSRRRKEIVLAETNRLGAATELVERDRWECDFNCDGYRLPTEEEWEYACRAGSGGAFCFGDDDSRLPDYAWYVSNSRSRSWTGGRKLPNDWGLFDMHGNVWEWCWDPYADRNIYNSLRDPRTYRVLRGGAYDSRPTEVRSAFRTGSPPAFREYWDTPKGMIMPSHRPGTIGFRVARTVPRPSAITVERTADQRRVNESESIENRQSKKPTGDFTVRVFKQVNDNWQEQTDRKLETTDAFEALRYAASQILPGWRAETNAAFDCSGCRRWTYNEKDDVTGEFVEFDEGQWIEKKNGKIQAVFREVTRTKDFIELYDESRSLSLRLLPVQVLFKTKSGEWTYLSFFTEPTIEADGSTKHVDQADATNDEEPGAVNAPND